MIAEIAFSIALGISPRPDPELSLRSHSMARSPLEWATVARPLSAAALDVELGRAAKIDWVALGWKTVTEMPDYILIPMDRPAFEMSTSRSGVVIDLDELSGVLGDAIATGRLDPHTSERMRYTRRRLDIIRKLWREYVKNYGGGR